mmetsp:Transcript_9106/g.32270  ORF Transcript_9106/g.32270 Transcript_9106/m.32270 type:complete len:288 (+) Transcript_9106:691-1554(+)
MMAIGPLVLLGQKLLVLLMTTLTDAMKAMNESLYLAWNLCTDVKLTNAMKIRQCQRCAIDIFEKSHIMIYGPSWLQLACDSGIVAGTFKGRPYGTVLAVLGFMDKVVVTQLTERILSVIPSWIENDINNLEKKLGAIGKDVNKLAQVLDEHLRKIKNIFDKAGKTLREAQDYLKHARATVAKESGVLGTAVTKDMEATIDKISGPFNEIQKDVDLADAEITKIENEIKKQATKTVDEIMQKLVGLTKMLDSLKLANLLLRLDGLADAALYSGVVKLMASSKASQALP